LTGEAEVGILVPHEAGGMFMDTTARRGHVLERSQLVAAPLDEVFAFFAEPRNLARLTPRWLSFRMVDTEGVRMRAGERIEYRIRPFGVPQRWISEITVYEPPHRFVDEQRAGPYRRWHHEHTFEAVGDGTRIADRVEYELPLGVLGRIVHAAVVQRQLGAIFDYRARVVAEMFEPRG
jgi:ligand-binding SRPBCC domain-containing protein